MLSKDISLDEKVDALSCDSARLLFTWLIPHLDVEGRMYGDARLIKSIVVPRRNYSLRTIEKYLNEMEKLGLIQRYFANNFSTNRGKVGQNISKNQYLFAPNFEKHQVGLRKDKEAQSRIPPLPPELLRTKDGLKTDLLPPKRSRSLIEEKFNRREGPPYPPTPPKPSSLISSEDIEILKKDFPDINLEEQLKLFDDYWSEDKRTLKKPKLALRKWLIKAREIKSIQKEGQSGTARQNIRGIPGNRPAGAFSDLEKRDQNLPLR